jgi:PAS domain S-box-containing protein
MSIQVGRIGREDLTAAVEQSADAIVITDTNGKIEYVNPAFTTITGYDGEEVLGRNPRVLQSGQHSREFYADLWRTIGSGEVWAGELVNLRKDGTLYNEEMRISPVRDASGEIGHFVAVKRDVSERKAAESKLRESEALFERIFEHAPLGVCLIALDGRFLRVNAALCRILKYSGDQLLTKKWMELTHPDDLNSARASMRDVLQSVAGYTEAERRYRTGTNEIIWVRVRVSVAKESGGSPSYYVVHVDDITERRRSRETIRESEARFRIMADGCPAFIWVTDAEGGKQFVNQAYKEFFSTSFEAVSGSKWSSLLHPEDLHKYIEAFRRARDGRTVFRGEARLRRGDGEQFFRVVCEGARFGGSAEQGRGRDYHKRGVIF